MKLNIKLNQKNILLGVYLLILVINLIFAYYVFSFLNENFYKVIYTNDEYLLSQSNFKDVDIDADKFDSAKNFMEEKNNFNKISDLNNIFD